MKVLLIDNYDSFTYNLAQLLIESKLCDYEIVKNDEIIFEKVNIFDKIILSPGADIPSKAGKMPELIKKYYNKKPILGVCLGMQGLAEFFGCKLYNLQNVYHGVKKQISIIDNDLIFNNLDKKQFVGLYHSWAVENKNIPKEINITAISEDNIIMAFSHTKYNIRGVQFHPESYMTENGKQMINNWLSKS